MEGSMDEEITEFIRSRYALLLRRAFLLTGDAGLAQDLVQESLTRLWMSWSRRTVENPDAYLRRVMVNASISTWRNRRRVQTVDEFDAKTLAVPDGAEESAEHDRVWAALIQLPGRQRAILVLRYYEDLSEAEICQALSISPGTVRSQTYKARQTLRQVMSADEGAAL
jgi:RNA polymerase sigma-70 factor (ECF subfamily)